MANETVLDQTPLDSIPGDAVMYIIVDGQDFRTTKDEFLGAYKDIFLGSVIPTDTPTGTTAAMWIATESGTYTNFGGVVVDANSIAVISRDDAGDFSISQTEIELGDYAKKEDLGFPNQQGELDAENIIKINTPITVFKASNAVDSRTIETWYKGISSKIINRIEVPIVRRLTDDIDFTDSLILRIGLNGVFIETIEISLSVINDLGYNAMTVATPDEDFYYKLKVNDFQINEDDVLYVGLTCKNSADRMGFPFTQNTTNEWGDLRFNYGNFIDLQGYATPPAPSSPSSYAMSFRFSFDDYVETKIKRALNSNVKSYSDLPYSRNQISSFLSKVQGKENIKIVVLGDSIANFQNSETLTLAEQKTAPIGLCGNSWVRQFWQNINYNVFNDARTSIVNANGNLGFKRFDHADAVISNGYQGTSAAIGSNDWATNRNDASDAWRNVGFETGFAQAIMAESTYNKPMIGTLLAGASFQMGIPSDSIGCSVVFGRSAGMATNVNVNIYSGSPNFVDENIDLTSVVNCTELHRDYVLNPTGAKAITVTNVSGGALWIWGVEYWNANAVRVINSGTASGTTTILNDAFDFQVENHDADLIVYQTTTGNDYSTNVITHQGYAKTLFNKLKALDKPVVTILCHRFVGGKNINREETGSGIIGISTFWPDYTKTFKSLAYENSFAIIDMFRKSIDEIGVENGAVAPTGYLLDEGHLGVLGNESYTNELKKIIMWDDFE